MRNTLRILSIVLLITSIFQARAADTKISALVELAAAPATDDLFAIVDISDTTQAASGSTKKIQVSNVINDTAWASSWDSKTTQAASKNAVYDWGHTFDTDDDGKVNVLDQGVGIAITDSGGVLQTPITTSALFASAINDETGTGVIVYGTNPFLTGPDLIGTVTLGTEPGMSANHITIGTTGIIFEGATADANEGLLTVADPTADRTWTLPNATGQIVLEDNTVVFTGKTYDASASGNTLKTKKYIVLKGFDNATGALPQNTNDYTLNTYMVPIFSNSADQAANYIEWRIEVPNDIDTAVDPRGKVKFKLTGADTGTQRYVLSMVSVADSAAYVGTPSTAINLDFAGDASGASLDVESVGYTTLTGWGAAVTAGNLWVIRLARDGDAAQDGSTVDSAFNSLTIEFGSTQ
jgi:hypothetical protein